VSWGEDFVTTTPVLPHVEVVLKALRIGRDRLDGRGKLAVDASLVKHLLVLLAATAPFDESFYRSAYPDLAEAKDRGEIADLHRHFVEAGFLEGRFGRDPRVDTEFYVGLYPDVAKVIEAGGLRSASEHYLHAGAAEGRAPSAEVAPQVIRWLAVLRPDA